MASGSFFIQRPEDALRHINLLTKGLKQVAWAGFAGGAGCSVMAVLLGHFLMTPSPQSNAVPGVPEISGITSVAWFMGIALLAYSSLYLVTSWGLSRQKKWARYAAAAVFISKVLLCVWLGRGSVAAMIVFLLIASCDLYGLWVLLSNATGQVFSSQEVSRVSAKPANLVT
jgi:hypothetical protein